MADNVDFDAVALKAKYDAERDKRLRGDGNAQYVHMEGQFAHFLDDPYSQWTPREPVVEDLEVVVLGGGFGGLMAGARLRQAGVANLRIIERAGDFGGTWYWNRYPGAACDTESYIYMPLLEEVGYMPTEKYARGPEIAAHARAIGHKFDLYRQALFQTEITAFEWDDAAARWHVKTNRHDVITARFVIVCAGHYQNPKLPGIPGIQDFKGHSFHTSRWDYDYTGGDCLGALLKLQDKTVGIIGTGATAIQCVPHLGRWAGKLYVFQRTPSSVDIRANRPTDPEWVESLTPGWQKKRMDNFTNVTFWQPVAADLVDDYWTKMVYQAQLSAPAQMTEEQRGELLQVTDFKIMESIRSRVDSVVKNKAAAAALKPWYNRACKRPCFHDEYLETFNRENVELVDTQGKGVERITENALVVAGKEYEVDCLIYATGFDLAAFAGISVPIYGRGAVSLSARWKEGAQTLHGIHCHGFPNLFILSTTQSAWDANFVHMMEEQSRHIAYIIDEVRKRGAETVEVTAEAEQEWVATHEQLAVHWVKIWAECTPSYFNNEGKPSPLIMRNGGFGAGPPLFINILEQWRAAGELKGLVLRRSASTANLLRGQTATSA
jgi:cyclohexanone monooxygenase